VSADALRVLFDAPKPLTIGLEEEVMLLDPVTLDLAPLAPRIVGSGLKLELPASQLEIATEPAASVAEAVAELAAGRRRLVSLAGSSARPAAAGVHPFSAPLGSLNAGERYDAILADYGDVARSQLVCALQVHVAVGGADATLAVHNALRGHLPELAALAANAPFHAGRDTGFASVRPLISGLLPRQGVPPAIPSWEAFAETLRWGRASGAVDEPRRWWWELRPHLTFGTLEVRVCDTQTTVGEAAAVAAFAYSLVGWLLERFSAGESLEAPETWRIAENRFAACRWGVEGRFADLVTGEQRPVRDVLRARLAELAPVAARLGCDLEGTYALVERNGALRQREVGLAGVTGWLADQFLAEG
jgi:glutamate---cysteine ligase / carboxylate-amine ligase